MLTGNNDKGAYFKTFEYRPELKDYVSNYGVFNKPTAKPSQITGVAYDQLDSSGGTFVMSADNGCLYLGKGSNVIRSMQLVKGAGLGALSYYRDHKYLIGTSDSRILLVRCLVF